MRIKKKSGNTIYEAHVYVLYCNMSMHKMCCNVPIALYFHC